MAEEMTAPTDTFSSPIRESPVNTTGPSLQATTIPTSFALPKDFKPASVKLDNIEPLEGQSNYEGLRSTTTSTSTISDIALVTTNNKQTRRRARLARGSTQSSTNTKVCTYCKRHGGIAEGHLWQDCRKLKRHQKRKQE